MEYYCSASGTFGACSLSLMAAFLEAWSQPSLPHLNLFQDSPSTRNPISPLWSEGYGAWLAASVPAQASGYTRALLPISLWLLAFAVVSACEVFLLRTPTTGGPELTQVLHS